LIEDAFLAAALVCPRRRLQSGKANAPV
jgi:hypothetical protein